MRYLINSPVLTAYGLWRFSGPLDREAVRAFLAEDYVSAIGHEATAQWLTDLLGISIAANRITVAMRPGDVALVVRIKERLPEGVVLGRDEIGRVAHEFGLLERLE